jgi:hypothetical protein
MSDLKTAYEALKAKATVFAEYWKYYDGNQTLHYSSSRLREVFRNIDAKFVENWCAVVIDATLERIQLTGFDTGDKASTDRLAELWQSTGMELDDNDVHLATLVCGEAYVFIWPDADGKPQAFYNDPRLCHVQYDAENPRKKAWAAKWWKAYDGRTMLNLYYSDRIEYYATKGGEEISSEAAFFLREDMPPAENPYDVVPIFPFALTGRGSISELYGILPLQDAVNKLFSDMMVSSEFGAFKQRWIISNADTNALRNSPYETWMIPAGDGTTQTQVGEFTQTDLAGYISAMQALATAIAVQKRIPKHYLMAQGGDPSGEALIALEAPLNKKCSAYIERFKASWRDVAAFLLKIDGADVDPMSVQPLFAKPETIQPRTQGEIRKMSVEAGIPLKTHLQREEGWTENELKQLDKDKEAERTASSASLAKALLDAQRNFDQEGNQPLPQQNAQAVESVNA